MCHTLLGPPLPGHKPGWSTGERYCDRCAPQMRCHVQQGDPWSLHFTDGPWLLFETEAEVRAVIEWGHPVWADFTHDIATWGRTSVELRLTEIQRLQLRARRKGWPWNGYELLQMWRAGRYPPDRLSPQQERTFLARRKRVRY